MDGIISFASIAMLIAFIVTAVWVICNRVTIGTCIATSIGFICAGVVLIPYIHVIATFVCWAVVIGIVLLIFGLIFGN